MSLIGQCDDCGVHGAQLRYKPDVPHADQSRPSICDECKYRREELVQGSNPGEYEGLR